MKGPVMKWIPLTERRPSDGQLVDWIAPNGTEIAGGKYISGLWYIPDTFKAYSDKPPVFWRPTAPAPLAKPAPKVEGKK